MDPDTGEILEEQGASPAQDHGRENDLSSPEVMSLEDARVLLARVHEVGLSKDDPVLMMVTLHQGFCADLAKINGACIHEIKSLLDATGKGYAQSVDDLFVGLQDKTISASINNTLAMTEQFTRIVERHEHAMRRNTWFVAFLTLLAVGSVSLSVVFS